MQHIPWNGDMAEFPEPLRRYLRPGHVFDSSSSAEATVYYSDIGQGCYYQEGPSRRTAERGGNDAVFS